MIKLYRCNGRGHKYCDPTCPHWSPHGNAKEYGRQDCECEELCGKTKQEVRCRLEDIDG